MKCTGKSKVYVLDERGKRAKDADGRFVVELDEAGKPKLKPCAADAWTDHEVCGAHGARAPQARTAASRRGVEREARGALVRLGVPAVADPLTALSQLAGEVLAFKDALAEKVNQLKAIRYTDDKGAEQLRSEVVVLERAFDRCAAVLAMIAKLNIDERLARISERQADAVIAAIDAGLAHAGLTGPAAAEARQVVARRLRSV